MIPDGVDPDTDAPATSVPRLPRRGISDTDLVSVLLVAVLAVLVSVTSQDYGITWDEPIHFDYGDAVLDYFLSLGGNTRAVSHPDHQYGPVFDLLGSVVRGMSSWGRIETMRLVNSAIGLVGLVGAWRLARLVAGDLAGLLALIGLSLCPLYYGHMFNNPKDIPFAAGYVWAIYYLQRVAIALPNVSNGLWVRCALAMALATVVRVGGLIVYGFLALGVGWYRIRGDRPDRVGRHGRSLALASRGPDRPPVCGAPFGDSLRRTPA
ncbi:MAG: conserved membrane protein of unknown function [bacterium]|nr:MAG: conserved membrane protein of unknown function [bacterium]